MKAVIYLRISTQTNEEGNGFDRQLIDCQRLAKGENTVFKDIVTGVKPFAERVGFAAMLDHMDRYGIKTIYVSTMCRLARELRIQEQIVYYLISKDFDLICSSTGENITNAYKSDPMKTAMIQMLGIFSQLEKRTIVAKLKKGREAVKAEKGKCEGRKAYGEVCETEKAILALMFLIRDGKLCGKVSYGKIAIELNSTGYNARSGRPFTGNLVQGLMKNSLVKLGA